MSRPIAFLTLASVLALCQACSATLGNDEHDAADSKLAVDEGADSAWSPGSVGGDPNSTAALPLRLLTSAHYEATLKVIFEDHYHQSLPPIDITGTLQAEVVDGSGFLSVAEISDVSVLRYLDAANAVVAALGSEGVDSISGCNVGAEEDSAGCIRDLVSNLGRLLYRRPLSDDEVASHTKFWDEEKSTLQSSSREATEQLLRSMLTSPNFLYRWELLPTPPTVTAGAIRLNPFQIASRLAFFLWGSGPSSGLIQLAEDGGLDTDEKVRAQAVLMLKDARAETALRMFHRGWLHLEKLDGLFKDPSRFPEWGPELRDAMQREVETFTQHVILKDDGRLETLLQAPYSFVNQPLAQVYGISGVTGDNMVKVDLPSGERAGLLTMPALLATASEPSVENPFKRGKLLLEQILCRKLEPPPDVPPIPPPDASNPEPIRETLETMTSEGPCAGCHQYLNPLGFGLGNYNAIGGYQTNDDLGFAVDASGELTTGETFDGPVSLAAQLSGHLEVKGCITKQWLRFALNREETRIDDYSLQEAYEGFETTDFNIRELLTAIVTTRSFLYRSPEEGEVTQ